MIGEKEIPVKLYWTKDAFKYNHSFYAGTELVGELKDKTLNRSVKATLFGKKYLFEKSGFISTKILIFDVTDRIELGIIRFKAFRPRAVIELEGIENRYLWKFRHSLTRRWELTTQFGTVQLTGKSRKEGFAQLTNAQDPVLLLSALVIRNHLSMKGYS